MTKTPPQNARDKQGSVQRRKADSEAVKAAKRLLRTLAGVYVGCEPLPGCRFSTKDVIRVCEALIASEKERGGE
jgi:hypothetical protein